MAATDEDDILSLETILTRPKIRIDRAVYEITAPGELSLEQNYRLSQAGQKLANLRGTKGLKPAQQAQMTTILNEICDVILQPVPSEVRKTLTENNKIAVIEVFTMLLSAQKAKLAGATLAKLVKPFLGEKASQDFKSFMAEQLKAG